MTLKKHQFFPPTSASDLFQPLLECLLHFGKVEKRSRILNQTYHKPLGLPSHTPRQTEPQEIM